MEQVNIGNLHWRDLVKKDEMLKSMIQGYLKDRDIYEDKNFSSLVPYYIDKARHNLLMAKIICNISEDIKFKQTLSIPDDFIAFDWVIITGYYAMFHIATALLGTIGIRTRSHESLINALEYQFVHKKDLLETDFIKKISKAKKLEEHYINRMWTAKTKRIMAHYRAEKEVLKKDAYKILDAAIKFVDRLQEIILQPKEE